MAKEKEMTNAGKEAFHKLLKGPVILEDFKKGKPTIIGDLEVKEPTEKELLKIKQTLKIAKAYKKAQESQTK